MVDDNARLQMRVAQMARDDRIDVICDAFEEGWQRGSRPDISTYLVHCRPEERGDLFKELVLLDIELSQRLGSNPTLRAYATLHEEFHEQLEELNFGGAFDTASLPLASTVATDIYSPIKQIGRYKLIERVGVGSAGEVWKSYDNRLGRFLAIKIATPTGSILQEPERLLREAKTAAKLRHPNIVSVYDVGCENRTTYIASEYIDGQDLRSRLAAARCNPWETAELCAAIGDALHYAHELGVIHRDLKPANILLNSLGRPHIADFGLAKWRDDAHGATLFGQLLGTPAYMSPEQARGDACKADHRSDIFALGVVLYEMLTGVCPFRGNHDVVLNAIVKTDPSAPRRLDRKIPRDLETICLKALAKAPSQRYQTAEQFADDLRRFLRGDNIRGRRVSPLRRCLRFAKRRPALITCIALATIAITAFALLRHASQRNSWLEGYRTVSLATEPDGARVSFVRISEKTGEPEPIGLIEAEGRSPVTAELKPGDYLVVTALADGRFHEVVRHVPGEADIPSGHKHTRWVIDRSGTVQLPPVRIPSQLQTETTAPIEWTASGPPSAAELSGHPSYLPPFRVQQFEFTVGDYRRLMGKDPSVTRGSSAPSDESPLIVTFDDAVMLAEAMGMRLPTAAEFECVATSGWSRRYPWGDAVPTASSPNPSNAVPAGTLTYDATSTSPAVHGLCSSVGEWTITKHRSSDALNESQVPSHSRVSDRRIVKGLQNPHFESQNAIAPVDPRYSTPVLVRGEDPKVGFRLYRSEHPRLTRADFAD